MGRRGSAGRPLALLCRCTVCRFDGPECCGVVQPFVTVEGSAGVGLMGQCNSEWFLRVFAVTCEGAVGVCLMNQCDTEWFLRLFTVTCEDSVGVGLMGQCNTMRSGSFGCLLLPLKVQ